MIYYFINNIWLNMFLDSFKITKNTRISSLKVPNYPLSGKFQGFLFISNYSKVVDRNDGFEFKNLYEKKKFIQC